MENFAALKKLLVTFSQNLPTFLGLTTELWDIILITMLFRHLDTVSVRRFKLEYSLVIVPTSKQLKDFK